MADAIVGGIFGLLAVFLGVLLPYAIKGRRAARHKDQLIEDFVLGDSDRQVPSMLDRDASLRALIEQRTSGIQPGSNGGESLTDLHRKIDAKFDQLHASVEAHLDDSVSTWEEIRARLAKLENERAIAHQEAIEMWKAIGAVAKETPTDTRGEQPI